VHVTKHRVLASIVLATVALIAVFAISASASAPLKITNCNKAVSRPKLLTLTCGDGNTVLKALIWSSFGAAAAQAKGTLVMNTCEPNCAQGEDVSYKVAVAASAPRTCKGGVRVYNKVALVFSAAKPKSSARLKNWTLGCPI
jgi:hypothetical protein